MIIFLLIPQIIATAQMLSTGGEGRGLFAMPTLTFRAVEYNWP